MSDWKPLRFNSEMCFLWAITDKRFSQFRNLDIKKVAWQELNWNELIGLAHISRGLMYRFSKEVLKFGQDQIEHAFLQKLQLAARQGDQNLIRLEKTLATMKMLWDGKVDYFVIKTRDDRPTGDADVLFTDKKDYELAVALAKTKGFGFTREEPFKGWIGVRDGLKIELHQGLSWFGMKALDNDFLVKETKRIKLMNLDFNSVGGSSELALELAHWTMDIQPLGPLGFSNLTAILAASSSLIEVLSQAEKHAWAGQLEYNLSVLKAFYEYIYFHPLDLPIQANAFHTRIYFPFWIPVRQELLFLIRKVLHDNVDSAKKMRMLSLMMRRYAWSRLSEYLR